MGSDIIHHNGHDFKLLVDESTIRHEIEKLVEKIDERYEGEQLEIVVVLKGAFIFAADLCRSLKVKHSIHFVKFTSYEGMNASPIVKCDMPLEVDVEGKHLLIVEDIIDSGNTMKVFLESLEADKPKSLSICTFLLKPNAVKHKLPLDFVGLEIDNAFVIGYGMDYDESCRSLNSIYQKI